MESSEGSESLNTQGQGVRDHWDPKGVAVGGKQGRSTNNCVKNIYRTTSPIEARTKATNRHFTNEETPTAKKHTQRCPALLIRET